MKLTDLMVALILFGAGFAAIGGYVFSLETQYATSNYTQTFNPSQYESLISEQAARADESSGLASSNTELGTESTTSDPYRNIFVAGWNAIKDLLNVPRNVENLQADLQVTSAETGLNIPGWAWGLLTALIAIIVVTTLINSTQRVTI